MCILSCLFPGFSFQWVLGLNLDVQGWKTKHFAKEVLQKSTFAEVGILMIPGSISSLFSVSLGAIFMTFVALESGMKFDDFSG